MLAEIFGLDAVVVAVVAIAVLFGGSQIPKLARSLGSAKREFRHGLTESDAPTPGELARTSSESTGDAKTVA
jgi:sec-independent protein translocase protein TatA